MCMRDKIDLVMDMLNISEKKRTSFYKKIIDISKIESYPSFSKHPEEWDEFLKFVGCTGNYAKHSPNCGWNATLLCVKEMKCKHRDQPKVVITLD